MNFVQTLLWGRNFLHWVGSSDRVNLFDEFVKFCRFVYSPPLSITKILSPASPIHDPACDAAAVSLHLFILRENPEPCPPSPSCRPHRAAWSRAHRAPSNPHRGAADRGRPEQLGFCGAPGELLAQCAEGGRQDAMRERKENGGGDNV